MLHSRWVHDSVPDGTTPMPTLRSECCGCSAHRHQWYMLCLPTYYCIKRAYLQLVDVIAAWKIAIIEYSHLETDVCSKTSNMHTACLSCQNPHLGWLLLSWQYYMSFCTAVIPKLQLWHLYSPWTAFNLKCHGCGTLISHALFHSLKHYCLDLTDEVNTAHIPV